MPHKLDHPSIRPHRTVNKGIPTTWELLGLMIALMYAIQAYINMYEGDLILLLLLFIHRAQEMLLS